MNMQQLTLFPESNQTIYKFMEVEGKILVYKFEYEITVDTLLQAHEYVNKKHNIKSGEK